jgi:hypothetical protein
MTEHGGEELYRSLLLLYRAGGGGGSANMTFKLDADYNRFLFESCNENEKRKKKRKKKNTNTLGIMEEIILK